MKLIFVARKALEAYFAISAVGIEVRSKGTGSPGAIPGKRCSRIGPYISARVSTASRVITSHNHPFGVQEVVDRISFSQELWIGYDAEKLRVYVLAKLSS